MKSTYPVIGKNQAMIRMLNKARIMEQKLVQQNLRDGGQTNRSSPQWMTKLLARLLLGIDSLLLYASRKLHDVISRMVGQSAPINAERVRLTTLPKPLITITGQEILELDLENRRTKRIN